MEEHKEKSHEGLQKSMDYLSKINDLLVNVQERVGETFKIRQEEKLKRYKQNLLKTKNNFEKIHEHRNDDNIAKTVFDYKKDLEKDCAMFFEQEVQVSKMYDKLKNTIGSMNSEERQLHLQIEYLQKQCKKAQMRAQKLDSQLKQAQKLYNIYNKKSVQKESQHDQNREEGQVLKEKDKQKILKKTQTYLFETNERIQNRIEGAKEYMDSLLFRETPLQYNFSAYQIEEFKTEKQKLKLIEQIFSKTEVKRQLYYLLFN